MSRFLIALFCLIVATAAAPAQAYVGPGSSLGAVGVVLGFVGTLFLALVSFIWYPIRRVYRRARRAMARSRPLDRR